LTSVDKRENFMLDVTRAQIKLTKATYQNRARPPPALKSRRFSADGSPMLHRLAVLLLLAAAAFAQRKDPAIYIHPETPRTREMPPSRSLSLAPATVVSLGALSPAELGKIGLVNGLRRIGVHRAVPDGSLARGSWTQTANGFLWRVRLQSTGATGIRINFTNFNLGDAKLWVHAGNSIDGPYTARGPYGNGDFWSGTVKADTVTIELSAAQPFTTLPFHVHKLAHQVQDASTPQPLPDYAAYCELDVNCYADWAQAKESVAHIEFEETQGAEQGTYVCSGAAVATRDNSFKPYLLTAGHCIHDEPAARSLETWWAYESAGCNLGPPDTMGTLNSQNGGDLVSWATIEAGDFSLVLLPNIPSGVEFAGWDTGDPAIGSSVTGIHHPMGSYKRISFGNTETGEDVFVGNDLAPASLYHLVNWNEGITEPGSSGSPLFTSPGVIVGTLTYGPDLPGDYLCQIGSISGYGKFSNAYLTLQPYLEDFPVTIVQPSASNVQFNGLNHAITGGATQNVTLTVQSASPVNWSARADAPWIQVAPVSGTVSASAPATLAITVNPSYFITSDTYTGTVTLLSGAAPPQFINVQVTMQIETSNVVATANPNPVPESGANWQLSLQLQETGGAATELTQMKIDGVDYSANLATWFGSTTLPANGTLTATLYTAGLSVPVTKYFEFWGKDVLSGATWYRLLTVTFTD